MSDIKPWEVGQPPQQLEQTPEPEPEDEKVYLQLIGQWMKKCLELKKIKQEEMVMRTKIAAHFFPKPKEGTNTAQLPDNWKLKGKYTYNRNIDEASLPAILSLLPEGTQDKVIKYTPELKLREYRALLVEHRKILDQALIIKPGTVALEVTPPPKPKEAKK